MIVDKTLKFGYGDISLGGRFQTLTFQQFKPPAEIGSFIDPSEVEFTSEEISINISYDDYVEYKKKLEQVEEKSILEFTFKGYTFDFTNWNIKSVYACKRMLEQAMKSYFMLFAC